MIYNLIINKKMNTILIQCYYVSKQSNSTFAQDEYWAISRRIGMLCYNLNNGKYNIGYKFENGGLVISNFEGRNGLTLVINGKHAFTDTKNFGLLLDYTLQFSENDYEDSLFLISEALNNSNLFSSMQRFRKNYSTYPDSNSNFRVRQSILID
jgi:hypothetical protein